MDKKNKNSFICKITKEKVILMIIIIVIIFIDQILKIWIQNVSEVNIIHNILNFKLSYNSYESNVNIITDIIILIIIFRFIIAQNKFVDMKLKIFLSFILAGGISNLIDKILNGCVIEFIDFKNIINFPVFNIADIFVLIGWICFVAIFTKFTFIQCKKNKDEKILERNKKDDKKE